MPNYKGMHEDELKENIRLRRRLEQVERENERLIEELSQTKKEVTDREDERDEARRLLEEAPCHPPQQRDALEACPFCGGNASIEGPLPDDGLGNEGGYVVCCSRCGASSPVTWPDKIPLHEAVAKVWNRRALTIPAVPDDNND